MELGNSIVLVLACILLVSGNADAKFKRGEINTEQDMTFMDTFYFTNTEDNVLEYNIRYPSDQCCYRLVIFDESYGQRGGIRPNEERLTCRGKIDRVKDLDYKIKLTGLDPACHVETDDTGFNWLVCHDRINFASRQRPQFYFVHLTNCRSNRKGLQNVTYSLHMTNGNNGLMKEFAENQKFMMETDLAFFLGYLAMLILATRFRYVLSKKKMLHLTYRFFYSSLFFKTVCLLLLNIELSRFARTGLEMTKVQDSAEIFSCLSTILFVSVLLLVSKGFTITRAQVSLLGTLKMILFGLVYGASYTVVFFDQRVLLDPQDIIASMTSLSAGGLICIKFTGCIVFVYGCVFTIKNYPGKALFYLPFTLFFSVWFVTEPTYRLLSIFVYPVLRSPNIWNGIDLVLSFAGHAYFLCITRPDLLNKRFPFHLQAGRISFRDDDDDVETIYQPSTDYSVFQTGKISTGTDTTLTIRDGPDTTLTIHDAPDTTLTIHDAPDTALIIDDGPEHFYTPVLPFNANSDELIPGPILPIPTVSATVADQSYSLPPTDWELSPSLTTMMEYEDDECRVPATRRQRKARPLFSAATMQETRPTCTPQGFISMPRVVPHDSMKIKPLLSMDDIPNKNRAAVGRSTVAVPKGGFSIFSVQNQPDAVTSPKVPDSILPEQIEKCYSDEKVAAPKRGFSISSVQKQPDVPTSPKVSDTDVTDHKQEKTYPVHQERPSGYSFLPPITPSSESTKSSLIKTIERPGPAFQLTKPSQNVFLVTGKPYEEPLLTNPTWEIGSDAKVPESKGSGNLRQITVRPADESYLQIKAIGESGSDTTVPESKCLNHCIPKVRLIKVQPADDPYLQIKTARESGSDTAVPEHKGLNNSIPNIRVINVHQADEPFQTKATRESGSDTEVPESNSQTNVTPNFRDINVHPADEPFQTKATRESGCDTAVPESNCQTNGTPNVRVINVWPADGPFQTKDTGKSGSDTAAPESNCQTNVTPNVRVINVRPADDPFQTKATRESGSDTAVPEHKGLNNSIPKVRVINVRPADDPFQTKATRESGSDAAVPESNCQTNGTPNVRVINVRPADDPFETKAIGDSRSDIQSFKSEGLTKASDHVCPITVRSADEPLQTEGNEGSGFAAQPPKILGIASDPIKIKEWVSAWVMDSVKQPKMEVPKPVADPMKRPFQLPAPKILNWTIEPLEIKHCKTSSGLIPTQPVKVQEHVSSPEPPKITPSTSSQKETPTKSLQIIGSHGPPTAPTDQTIGPRSEDQAWLPATDGGDFAKRAKKTQKEPSSRRFPKPTNPALNPDTTPPDEPQKAMDPKTKKKRLRKFLKLARKLKPKHKPAKADEE